MYSLIGVLMVAVGVMVIILGLLLLAFRKLTNW